MPTDTQEVATAMSTSPSARDSGSGAPNPGVWRRAPADLVKAAVVSGCALVIAAAVYVVGQLLLLLAPVTLAVVAALLLTALLSPVVGGLRRLRLPPWAAALGGLLTLLAALTLPAVLIGQQVASQFSDLGKRLDNGLRKIRQMLADGPLPISRRQVEGASEQLMDAAIAVIPGPARGAAIAIETVGAGILALVLLFLLLKDGAGMWQWLLRQAPPERRGRVDLAAQAGWQALAGYMRGMVVIAFADSVGIGLALTLVGVPLALPLAVVTFVAAFVPIVGATVAGAAAVLVALVANGPTEALIILAAVIAVQQIEGNLLEPLVMGHAVRLHPAVVLVAIAAGTVVGGVTGALMAVPLTAVTYRVVATLTAAPGTANGQPGGDAPGGQDHEPDDAEPGENLGDQATEEERRHDHDRDDEQDAHEATLRGEFRRP